MVGSTHHYLITLARQADNYFWLTTFYFNIFKSILSAIAYEKGFWLSSRSCYVLESMLP